MVDLAYFRAALKTEDPGTIVDDVMLAGPHEHVSADDVSYIRQSVAAAYGADLDGVQAVITGSAHLGFSLVQKEKGGIVFPRYRLFSAASDIDVAIIAPQIQKAIWHEISAFHHQVVWFPKSAGRLGDYITCGWFRPDYFPRDTSLYYCREWSRVFNRLSTNLRFRRHNVKGGLFATREHLKQYTLRAVRACISDEVSP